MQIPTLAADRMPHPEWGTAAAAARYSIAAGRLVAALDSAAVPVALLEGLRNLAAAGASVDLYLAPDRGLVQIVLDGRRIPLSGSARDAVLSLLGEVARAAMSSAGDRAAATPAPAFDASLTARAADVGAQIEESRAHAGEETGNATAQTVRTELTVIAAALMPEPPLADAGSLARAIGSSGLFLEAHLAQWLRGERSLRQVQDEVRDLPLDARSGDAGSSERRATLQLDALQRQAINLNAQAWPGQAVQLDIERDRRREDESEGDAAGLFQATLAMSLPHLGALRARIRIMQGTVGVQIEAEREPDLKPELARLASALSARGLNLAALDLAPAGGAAVLAGAP